MYCAKSFGDTLGITGDNVLMDALRDGGGIRSLSASVILIGSPLVLE